MDPNIHSIDDIIPDENTLTFNKRNCQKMLFFQENEHETSKLESIAIMYDDHPN